ncbi:choice-of-anchor P family protein [Actinomadura craniellae]|uniref:choice-of-anchor P family protein n=1 Tax=Actinomadura craniellae TaxID=2231787 RepID=UPI001314CD33|nr:choice-of-anchor P family protein [Actinomadura craniellae]
MRPTHLAKSLALATAVAAPLTISAPASHAAAGGHGAAHALAANGPVTIPPTPLVSSSGPRPESMSVVRLPANPLADASALTATAKAGHARSSVAELRVARAALSARVITARCTNSTGTTHLADVTLAGRRLQASPAPNSALTVSLDGVGKVTLVLNKQVRKPGGGLSVTAIELTIPGVQTLSVASVSCTPAAPAASPPGSPAPAPTPVPGNLPVTG